jgi:hypothetical protein
MFGNAEPGGRLDEGDAVLVDAIHSCGGSLGFPNPYTHVDFYPNGGIKPQPGCVDDETGEFLPVTLPLPQAFQVNVLFHLVPSVTKVLRTCPSDPLVSTYQMALFSKTRLLGDVIRGGATRTLEIT